MSAAAVGAVRGDEAGFLALAPLVNDHGSDSDVVGVLGKVFRPSLLSLVFCGPDGGAGGGGTNLAFRTCGTLVLNLAGVGVLGGALDGNTCEATVGLHGIDVGFLCAQAVLGSLLADR